MRVLPTTAVALLTASLLVACDGSGAERSPTREEPNNVTPFALQPGPASFLHQAQHAIDASVGYHLTIRGHNLVLPEWGGIDEADLTIGVDESTVIGTVERTGDGLYEIRYVGGRTYFRRETCDQWARVPGGGKDVFRPILWNDGTLEFGVFPEEAPGGETSEVTIVILLMELGRVAVAFDLASDLPTKLVQPRGARSTADTESTWEFRDWGHAPLVVPPPEPVHERGPGGNPC